MIVDLANETIQVTNAWQKFNELQAVLTDIQDTHAALNSFQSQLTQFINNYNRISQRLSGSEVLDIQIFCKDLRNITKESEDDFNKNRRQVAKIRNLGKNLNNAESNLNDYWSTYANELIEPYHELLELVFQLPEIQRQQKSIQAIKEKLEFYTISIPDTDSKLTEFNNLLHELDQSLSNLQGLSPIISDFLGRVSRGSFTLADISEEILEWCQEDDRGKSFKVSF